MKKRLSARFDGHVQGVGFRYTTCTCAAEAGVTGHVHNAPDGSVEAVAEGEEAALLRFLSALRCSPAYRHVRQESLNWSAATGAFTRFDIRY